MPIHDWTRVLAGTFHDFQCAWLVELRNVLNGGLLPPNYYAQAEQIAGAIGPDVLTLQSNGVSDAGDGAESGGAVAVAVAPPQTRFMAEAEIDLYPRKTHRVAIRHGSDDRVVAVIEIVSPGNKSSRHGLRSFVEKAVSVLVQGHHLLIADLFPPGPRDPQGIHGVLWAEFVDIPFLLPADKPLTMASYAASQRIQTFVEPVAVGDRLPSMPLFLDPETYVRVPLEETYQAAWRGVPQRWKRVLEADQT